MTKKSLCVSLSVIAVLAALLVVSGYAIEAQAAGPGPGKYMATGSVPNATPGTYMLAAGGGMMGGGMGGRGSGTGMGGAGVTGMSPGSGMSGSGPGMGSTRMNTGSGTGNRSGMGGNYGAGSGYGTGSMRGF